MTKLEQISFSDRLFSALSYLTAGWGGMIILVIMYFRQKHPSKFLRFNLFQSIFVSLLYFVLAMCLGLIFQVLSYIPFINYLVAQIAFLFNRPFFADYSIIQTFVTGLIFYMTIWSLLGKYPKIYWVSNIISRQSN
jgi:uncharacterized membrane protein